MPQFGQTSEDRLATCDRSLQALMRRAIATSPVDFTIVCGERDEAAQMAAYEAGNSRAKFGQSPHNLSPSAAVDVCPYIPGRGLVWDDDGLWDRLAVHIIETARKMDIPIQWGGSFTSIVDKPHFELRFWKELK